jgi:hypothetical protein
MNGKRIIVMVCLLGATLCGRAGAKHDKFLQAQMRPAIMALSMVMMHDVVSPTVASRYYMYCTLGSLALSCQKDDTAANAACYNALLKQAPVLPAATTRTHEQGNALAALFCIYETGMRFLPSGSNLKTAYASLRQHCLTQGFGKGRIAEAQALAVAVAEAIWNYSTQDGYRFQSTFPKYRPQKTPGSWFPTPPAYMDAVDPNWGKMRTMLLDSATQMGCTPPAPFDTLPGSPFRNLAQDVYEVSKHLTDEQREIAGFWDCNPFVVATAGHMSLGFKKISPGGHWMNIACLAAEKANLNFNQTIQLIGIEALTLYDAFIACWHQKYATARVRPETFINAYVDLRWTPLLQTPPFPEYTSGHSVISTASAQVLSYFLGKTFAYTDDTEVMFELAPRSFGSFEQAAAEAAISRLYGGIHFRDGIEQGQQLGLAIGHWIVQKLKWANVTPYVAN